MAVKREVPTTYTGFEAIYDKATDALMGRGNAAQFGFNTIKEGQYLGRDEAIEYRNSLRHDMPFTPKSPR